MDLVLVNGVSIDGYLVASIDMVGLFLFCMSRLIAKENIRNRSKSWLLDPLYLLCHSIMSQLIFYLSATFLPSPSIPLIPEMLTISAMNIVKA